MLLPKTHYVQCRTET